MKVKRWKTDYGRKAEGRPRNTQKKETERGKQNRNTKECQQSIRKVENNVNNRNKNGKDERVEF